MDHLVCSLRPTGSLRLATCMHVPPLLCRSTADAECVLRWCSSRVGLAVTLALESLMDLPSRVVIMQLLHAHAPSGR